MKAVAVKGDNTGWYSNTQNWGVNWEASGHSDLVGQGLSFRVTLGRGSTLECDDVAPSNWGFGQTFEADNNFY